MSAEEKGRDQSLEGKQQSRLGSCGEEVGKGRVALNGTVTAGAQDLLQRRTRFPPSKISLAVGKRRPQTRSFHSWGPTLPVADSSHRREKEEGKFPRLKIGSFPDSLVLRKGLCQHPGSGDPMRAGLKPPREFDKSVL